MQGLEGLDRNNKYNINGEEGFDNVNAYELKQASVEVLIIQSS